MSDHRYSEVPFGSRPTTQTDSDLDAYGTPAGNTPIVPPMPLGRGGMPAPVPSAFSLSSSSTPARDSAYNPYGEPTGTPNNNSAPLLQHAETDAMYGTGGYNKEAGYGAGRRRPFYKRPWFYVLLVVAAVVIALAVALPVTLVHKNSNSPSGASSTSGGSSGGGGSSGNGGGGGGKGSTALATSGGDGSTVTTDDGSTFVYHNSFGGFCECEPMHHATRGLKCVVHKGCPTLRTHSTTVQAPTAGLRRSVRNGPGAKITSTGTYYFALNLRG